MLGDAPSELVLCAIFGPLLPDMLSDSDADSAELAAASILGSRLPRLTRAGMALTFVFTSAADTQPLVALRDSGVDADADEEAIARAEGERMCK